jgi:hypothetical protein
MGKNTVPKALANEMPNSTNSSEGAAGNAGHGQNVNARKQLGRIDFADILTAGIGQSRRRGPDL